MAREQTDLDTFLEGLPEEDAAKARAAAAHIDELEHAAQRIGKSDKRYFVLFLLSGLMALAAAVMAFGGFELFKGGDATLGDMIVLIMASAFPVLVLVYSLRMNERTKIDRQQFKIIETYFLPYDAIYLPPGPDREKGVVALSQDGGRWMREPEKKVKKPGWYW